MEEALEVQTGRIPVWDMFRTRNVLRCVRFFPDVLRRERRDDDCWKTPFVPCQQEGCPERADGEILTEIPPFGYTRRFCEAHGRAEWARLMATAAPGHA